MKWLSNFQSTLIVFSPQCSEDLNSHHDIFLRENFHRSNIICTERIAQSNWIELLPHDTLESR